MPQNDYLEITHSLGGGRYFFMVNANESNKIIINEIM